jgi:hypothetical protein
VDSCCDVVDLGDQPEAVRDRSELVVFVEVGCVLVDRVDDDEASCDGVGRSGDPRAPSAPGSGSRMSSEERLMLSTAGNL